VKAWQARLWAAQGDRWAAIRWLEECGLSAEDDLSYPREFEHITLARMLMIQGENDEALVLLERLLSEAEAGGRRGRLVEILMLKALVLLAQNHRQGAVGVLRRALTLAEPEGYVRIFADEGAPMSALLEQLVKAREARTPGSERGVSPEYVEKLLTALGYDDMVSAKVRVRGAKALLVEPISEREIEVLYLLASGTPNREIAARLFVSLDTIKSHLKHIYNKLGVHSRTQAVARAKEMDLI
jgi:LuxR family maltose regulon positive regulatory protein